jgi:cytochrome c7-like protein/class III cytochrome C family protein
MRWSPLLAVSFALAQTPPPKYIPPPPVQPLPFSHKQHLGAGLECKNCHEMPDPGDFAVIPATGKCMTCHLAIKKDSPHIQLLADYHSKATPVPWKRVYRIPDYVFFSHKEHLKSAKATCETCHGPVRERDVMRKEKETSMAACMDCHRTAGASLACDFCHDQR